MSDSDSVKEKKGIYLLPNLLTTFGFISGFFSIILSLEGSFYWAIMAVFVASIFDLFDGTIARLTKSNTDFGAHYDSLSDLVSFGVAPAVLLYFFTSNLEFSPFIAVFYAICINLRLARFNTQIHRNNSHFQGLPSPASALCVVSFALVLLEIGWVNLIWVQYIFSLTGLLVAVLSISNFRYMSNKKLDENEKIHFQDFSFLVLAIILVAWQPVFFMPFLAYLYLFYGIFYTLYKRKKRRIQNQ